MDGIDVALIRTDGEAVVERLGGACSAYPEEFRVRLRQALAEAAVIEERSQRPGGLAALERVLTQRHADAVLAFLADRGLAPSAIDVIGFHGQTVLHRPEAGLTVQLGDGPLLAGLTGIDVVYDLRAGDVAAGGQGAPLVPVYHRALAARLPERPLAFLNLGGIANLTWIAADGALIAFDTGPGNALIDDWMLRHTGVARDEAGAAGRTGRVDRAVLGRLLEHPYFARGAPKSLDRNDFHAAIGAKLPARLSVADGAATLAAFTAAAVAEGLRHLPMPPRRWIVCGGGRRNAAIMAALRSELAVPVDPIEVIGCDGDFIEAEAWAYLAVRALDARPITFPGTTGVRVPQPGGVLARAPRM